MRQAALLPRGKRLSTVERRAAPRGIWLVIAITALLLAVTGGTLSIRRLVADDPHSTGTAVLGGLLAQPHDAGWVGMDGHQMDNQGGYQMPAQMMPGAPTGDDMRLGVPLTLTNTSDEPRLFDLAAEFALGGGRTGGARAPHSDTFGTLPRLAPGSAIDGVIYFDTVVPGAGDPPLYLRWTRDGRTVRLSIPMTGSTPEHGHTS